MIQIQNEIITLPQYPNISFMKLIREDGNHKYTIIDRKFEDKILKCKWYYNTQTGYVQGDPRTNKYTLHKFIMKECMGLDCPDRHSVDHINWKKLDNRSCNLRYASQAVQNANREIRCDKTSTPMTELQAIGIHEYPRHLRFDDSTERFVIDSHPQLKKEGKSNVNSTRKGGILNKYYDICMKGIQLDNEFYEERVKNDEGFTKKFKSYLLIAVHFNNIEENTFKFNLETPKHLQSFEDYVHLLEMSVKIESNCKNIQTGNEEATIVYNGDIKAQDKSLTLTKDMIPKYVSFTKETDKRGCKFTYNRKMPDGKKISKELSTGSKLVSLKEKYEEMQNNLKIFQEGTVQ